MQIKKKLKRLKITYFTIFVVVDDASEEYETEKEYKKYIWHNF